MNTTDVKRVALIGSRNMWALGSGTDSLAPITGSFNVMQIFLF